MKKDQFDSLREKAEKYIVSKPQTYQVQIASQDTARLIHELQVHQVELEMQNKELAESQVALARSKNIYTNLFEYAPIGYFILDKSGIINQVNIAGSNLLGTTRNKLFSNRFLSFVHPEYTRAFYDFIIKVNNSDQKESCEIQIISKNKKELYVQVESFKIYEEDSKSPQILTTVVDITERYNAAQALLKAQMALEQKVKERTESYEKANMELQLEIEEREKAEKSLKDQHELVSGIIEGTTDLIFVKDIEGNYLLVNSAACKMVGKSKEEIINKNDLSIFPKEEAVELLKLNKRIIKTGKSVVKEHIISFNNTKRKMLSTMGPFKNSEGEIIGVLGISHDITDYKIAKKERIRFLKMLENSYNEFYLINAETLKFEYVNAETCRSLGYSHEDIQEHSLFHHSSNLSREEYTNLIQPLLSGKKKKITYFSEHKRADGSKYPVEVNLQLLNEDNQEYILAVAIDITSRKEAEKALEAYAEECKMNEIVLSAKNEELEKLNEKLLHSEQELIEINANKDKFLYIMVHDLKSPFSSLIGSAQFLDTHYEKLEKGQVKQFIKNINVLAHNFKDILDDLLSLSALHHGTIPFNPVEINMDDLVNNIFTLMKFSADEKNINLLKSDRLGYSVKGDKAMINSILQNLITNAIKFTLPGGTVAIGMEDLGEEILVKVSDSGVGMDQKTLDKIFRIQDHHSTKGTANESGTGLGLILSKEFVEKHNGRMWVESEKGTGSSFFFTLPKS